jgi:hypothetical protein
MRQKHKKIWIVSLVITVLLFAVSKSETASPKSIVTPNPIIDKYQPFASTQSPVVYFPDEVEKQVEEALIEGYLGNREAILKAYKFMKEKDQTLQKAKEPITGLADELMDLANAQIKRRDDYLKAQERFLKSSPEPELEKLVRYRIKNDEFNKATAILKGDKVDKTGRVLNNFLRPINLASWGFGFLIPAAIDTGVNTAFYLSELDTLSLREKIALAEYQTFIRKYPESKLHSKAKKRIAELRKKLAEYQFSRAMAAAEKEAKEKSYDQAIFHLKQALKIWPDSKKAAQKLATIQQQKKQYQEELALSLAVKADSTPQDTAYQELLEALLLESPPNLLLRTNNLLRHNPPPAIKSQLYYLKARLQERIGDYPAARETLKEIKNKYTKSTAGKQARLVLNSTPYNINKEIKKARRRYIQKSLKYALFGQRFAKDNLALGASEVALEGAGALTTLGIFNLAAMGFRLGNLLLSNPISNQDIIDKGESLLAQYPPNAPTPKEVHKILAEAYEEQGNFYKAMEHYALSGEMSEEDMIKYRNKVANKFFARIQEEENPIIKRRYLFSLLRDFPDTEVVPKVSQELAKLFREDKLLTITKAQLKKYPAFFGANGINIKPELLDGKLSNRELGDKGITFLKEDQIKLSFIGPEGKEEERIYPVDKKIYHRLRILWEENQYQNALTQEGKRQWAYDIGGDLSVKDLNLQGRLEMPQNTALFLGGSSRNPYAGLEFPLPLIDQLIPLDFSINIKPSGISLEPTIRTPELDHKDQYLYQE